MREKQAAHRINQYIKVDTVRLVGDNLEVEPGLYDINFARHLASDLGLDLVEISKNSNPSVCKIVDYQKFLYEQKRKDKENKKKQKSTQIKELRLRPSIDDHDFNFKINHAKNFLTENNKVMVSVFFKGREINYKEKGELVLLKFADELKELGTPEALPKLEGKRMIMIIKPKIKTHGKN